MGKRRGRSKVLLRSCALMVLSLWPTRKIDNSEGGCVCLFTPVTVSSLPAPLPASLATIPMEEMWCMGT